jgi:hypothetical protein
MSINTTQLLELYKAGYHFIPMKIRRGVDGKDQKSPDVTTWTPFQLTQPDQNLMDQWMDVTGDGIRAPLGWFVICGTPKKVLCFDIERHEPALFKDFIDKFPDYCKGPSPHGGAHIWVTITDVALEDFPRGQRLARRFTGNYTDKGVAIATLLAEQRAAGQYAGFYGPGRVPPADWHPYEVTLAEYEKLADELRAFGDDIEALTVARKTEMGSSTTYDYGDTNPDMFQAEWKAAAFRTKLEHFGCQIEMTRFNSAYLNGILYRTMCPVHTADGGEHSTNSLQFGIVINQRPEFVWHCHTGCTQDEVAEAIGYTTHIRESQSGAANDVEVVKIKARMFKLNQRHLMPKPVWQVEGLLEEGSLTRIYGKESTYKSFISGYLAVCIGAGTPFFGHQTIQGDAVIIVAEGGSAVADRMDGLLSRYPELEAAGDRVTLLSDSVQILSRHRELIVAIKDTGFEKGMIVIDTQARTASGVKENDSTEMGMYINACDILRKELHASVLLVAHSGYDQTHARGSTAIACAVDTDFRVEKTGHRAGKLICTKQKNAEEGADINFRMEPALDSLVPVNTAPETMEERLAADAWSPLAGLRESAEKVMNYIPDKEPQSKNAIYEGIDNPGNKAQMNKAIDKLVSMGWMTEVAKRNGHALFGITPAGREIMGLPPENATDGEVPTPVPTDTNTSDAEEDKQDEKSDETTDTNAAPIGVEVGTGLPESGDSSPDDSPWMEF